VLAGSTIARTAHFALHRTALPEAPEKLFAVHDVWIGAMAPKRWAKRAVTRNAIKRQIYNVSTCYESALSVAAHVVRLRAGFDKTTFVSATSDALKVAVRQELHQLFAHAAKNSGAVLPSIRVVTP